MLTQEQLKKYLRYEPETGDWFWLARGLPRWDARLAGKRVWNVDSRGLYLRIPILGTEYLAHRLAFLYMTGALPVEVDHINGKGLDCRWLNLRPATRVQNLHNKRGQSNRKTGSLKGVKRNYGSSINPWTSSICVYGKRMHLGSFPSEQAAHAAYVAAAQHHFGEFARAA